MKGWIRIRFVITSSFGDDRDLRFWVRSISVDAPFYFIFIHQGGILMMTGSFMEWIEDCFDSIGQKIKGFSTRFWAVSLIFNILAGIVGMIVGFVVIEYDFEIGLIVVVSSVGGAVLLILMDYIMAMFLYGFGELVDSTQNNCKANQEIVESVSQLRQAMCSQDGQMQSGADAAPVGADCPSTKRSSMAVSAGTSAGKSGPAVHSSASKAVDPIKNDPDMVPVDQVDIESKTITDRNGICFNMDYSILVQYPSRKVDESYVVPKTIVRIGEKAFNGNTYLCEVSIGKGVQTIDKWAFLSCRNLKKIVYAGTKAEWRAIPKGEFWDGCTKDYIVSCSDGIISKGH